ncbi:twitching motility protein PilT [Streptomyces griseoincarnatus]|uniref:Twitching motility protein PilT n=1 Tax=Streptomyces griseoincarnatus TaxID=29305 RepID=A0ABT0VPE0_STRGI|nr:twitching motility protein PilT [Streptomyces griseoincarnatus]MCM2513210.1 twitching motility protein PilT [Streptomyces griseoincarnatus]
MNIPYLYDAGALIAIDNDDRRMWARHSLALEDGRDIHVPSVVVSQAWRDSRRQVRLGKFLAGCHVVPVGLETAKAAGVLCGKAGTADIVHATVVVMAASLGAIIWTSDPYDVRALIDAQDVKPAPVIRTV